MDRLRARFPHVLVLAFEPEGADPGSPRSYGDRLRGRSDLDVAVDFVDHVRTAPADDIEELVLREAFEAVRVGEAAR
jgi:exonuclease SbcD